MISNLPIVSRAVANAIRKAVPQFANLQSIDSFARGWFRVFESYTGAWQQNIVVDRDTVLSYSAVFACVTLISQDVGKLRIKLVEQQKSGIWVETSNPAFSPVLRKPNNFQTRIKFIEYWIACKLLHGNAYALKRRDNRGIVIALYLLDPCRVTPYVSADGSVFYRLKLDNLSGDLFEQLREDFGFLMPQDANNTQWTDVLVPATEIIHDPMVTLFHPLCGVSPIYACGVAAMNGANIQRSQSKFFANQAQPGGILTAPGAISDATAARLKAYWEENFTGDNAGKVAVVGDNLQYTRLTANAVDSQVVEQMKMSAEQVCACFHVPPFMIGAAPIPALGSVEALTQFYYSNCLQSLIESLELCLDEGLGLVTPSQSLGTEFDLDNLLRMDTAARYKSYADGVGGGWMHPNFPRLKEDMIPVKGGDTPYLQQQDFSLAALADRDADKPFAKPPVASAPPPQERALAKPDDEMQKVLDKMLGAFDDLSKGLEQCQTPQ